MASSTVCPVSGFLSSAVKMGMPFRKSPRSTLFFGLVAEVELAYDGEEVGSVQALEFLVEAARWLEVREPEVAAGVLDAGSQYVEGAAPGDLA